MIKLLPCTLFSLLLCASPPPSKNDPPQRKIIVDVMVITEKGDPLEDIPLFLITDDEYDFALTDENGMVRLSVETDRNQLYAEVRVLGGPNRSMHIEDFKERRRIIHHLRDMSKQYHIPKKFILDLPEYDNHGRAKYDLNIVAYPAIDVMGVIADHQGKPIDGFVVERYARGKGAMAVGGRQFRLGGIRRGAETTLYVYASSPSQLLIHPIAITKDKTRRNLVLGKIKIPPPPIEANSTVSFTLENTIGLSESPGWGLSGVTIINTELGHILTYVAKGYGDTSNIPPVQIPAGTYYLAHGWFGASEEQCQLIDWVRDGQDLSDTDIFTFEIKEGETKEITVDLLQAYHAIRNHAAKLRKQTPAIPASPKPPAPANP